LAVWQGFVNRGTWVKIYYIGSGSKDARGNDMTGTARKNPTVSRGNVGQRVCGFFLGGKEHEEVCHVGNILLI
jgi:hypothetical protein